MQTRIEKMTDKTSVVDKRPSAMHVVWYNPIWVSGGETYQDALIEIAGAKNAFPETLRTLLSGTRYHHRLQRYRYGRRG